MDSSSVKYVSIHPLNLVDKPDATNVARFLDSFYARHVQTVFDQ